MCAGAICTVSKCFSNVAFPSYTSRACSNFDTITSIRIRMHIANLVLTRGSVRIASIFPTCDLPFSITSDMCVSQGQSLKIFTPRYVYWSSIGNSSSPKLPSGMCRIHPILVTCKQLLRIFSRSLLSLPISSWIILPPQSVSGILPVFYTRHINNHNYTCAS